MEALREVPALELLLSRHVVAGTLGALVDDGGA